MRTSGNSAPHACKRTHRKAQSIGGFMTALPQVRMSAGPRLWRFIVEHNPFYLLSAACMLASVLALTNSFSWSPIATRRLITLIVTLNVYEGALIALALFLIV